MENITFWAVILMMWMFLGFMAYCVYLLGKKWHINLHF